MPEQMAKELDDARRVEVVFAEAEVGAHALARRRDAESRQRRDAVVPVAVADDGRLALRPPSPAARRNE
jgi:hypothetical protein